MGFKDMGDFFDPTLPLPIRGKVYVVESPEAKLGLKVQRLVALGFAANNGVQLDDAEVSSLDLDDAEERDLIPRLLGPAYQEMLNDGVPWEMVKHAGETVIMWIGIGYEAAEAHWENTPGKSHRPTPQDRKAPARKPTTRKTSSTRTSSATVASPAGSTDPSPTLPD